MTKGVGHSTIDRHHCPDAHATYHESHLVDNAVGQNASHIIFQQGINNPVNHHDASHHDEYLPARESPNQCIDRSFRGIGTENNASCHSGLRVGVGEPGVYGRDRSVEQNSSEDKVIGQVPFSHGVEDD